MPAAASRKPYRITKPREKWTDEEHMRFLDGLKKHGREWKKIVAHVETRSVAQVRSHAQKYFLKLEKSGQAQQVPPPRAKKRPARQTPMVMVRDGTPPTGLRRTGRRRNPPPKRTERAGNTVVIQTFRDNCRNEIGADDLGDSNSPQSRGQSSSSSQDTSNSATLGGVKTQQSSSSLCNMGFDMEAKPPQFFVFSGQALPDEQHDLAYKESMDNYGYHGNLGTSAQLHGDVVKSEAFHGDFMGPGSCRSDVYPVSWASGVRLMDFPFVADMGMGLPTEQCSGSPGGSEGTNVHGIAGVALEHDALFNSCWSAKGAGSDFDELYLPSYLEDYHVEGDYGRQIASCG